MPGPRKSRALALACLWGVATAAACADAASAGPRQEVLVYTRTLGFRHASIPAALTAIVRAAEREGLRVRATEDPSAFTPEALRGTAAVVFLLTTGEVLDARRQEELQSYVRAGGGFLGIHSAADTGHSWPWYLELVGAEFLSHPQIQPAVVLREERNHPATSALPDLWPRTDEWYDFRASPRGRVRVLLSIDEASYQGGLMGADHPLAWCHRFEGGRAVYTALGHTVESWSEPLFLEHVSGALRWAAGLAEANCEP